MSPIAMEAMNRIEPRLLIDLPPEEESRFHPSSFMPRKFLERFRRLVKKELRSRVLVPPPNVAGYESNGYYRRAVTWAMVMERRRQQQAVKLRQIRSDYNITYRKPLYVWVFWCPGISNSSGVPTILSCFRGWWIYFVGHGCDYRGGGYKGNIEGTLFDEIMKMFPVENPHPLYALDEDEWMQLFAKQYQRGKWCGKPQGKAPIWAEVRGESVEKILGRAKWSKGGE